VAVIADDRRCWLIFNIGRICQNTLMGKGNSVMRRLLSLAVIFSFINLQGAAAASLGELSHIHNIRVHQNKIFLGTHEGLYQYFSPTKVVKIEPDSFDVMGLATNQSALFASGHPGINSKFAQPVGVLSSADNGVTWKQVSLKGEVDFHMLEVGKADMYGVNSGKGELMYSANLGKSWSNRGVNTYSDIAIDSSKAGLAFGLKNGQIYKSTDSFKSEKLIKSKLAFSAIELVGKRFYGSSGSNLYLSTNGAASWATLATFDKSIGVISTSESMLLVAAGDKILISRDLGKSFK